MEQYQQWLLGTRSLSLSLPTVLFWVFWLTGFCFLAMKFFVTKCERGPSPCTWFLFRPTINLWWETQVSHLQPNFVLHTLLGYFLILKLKFDFTFQYTFQLFLEKKLILIQFLQFRLYISYSCPYAQRVWITRNCKVVWMVSFFIWIRIYSCFVIFDQEWCSIFMYFLFYFAWQGLQDTIKLVPIDLNNRPAWYKEKVYPENKVNK